MVNNDELLKLQSAFQHIPLEDRPKYLKSLNPAELNILFLNPRIFLFNKQIPPNTNWRYHWYRGGRGIGKQLSLNTEIPTVSGIKLLSELTLNDQLFDENGNVCNILQLHPINISPESYELEFDDGTIVQACGDHLWFTWDKKARKAYGRAKQPTIHPSIRNTREIANTLKVSKKRETNHSIRNTLPVKFNTKELLIDPYLLGLWLGDGTTSSGSIETADISVLYGFDYKLVPSTSSDKSKSCQYRLKDLTIQLKQLNVLNNKHIPNIYLMGDVEQRLSLLQGLLDSDGCCLSNGQIEYCSVLPILAEQVKQLIQSLGIKCSLNQNESWLYDKRCKDRYRIYFITKLPVFRLERKLKNLKSSTNQDTRNTHRYIVRAGIIKPVPMRCITVDSPNNLYLITKSYIPTHNTFASTSWLYEKIINGAQEVAIVGPSYGDLIKEILPVFESHFAPKQKPKFNPKDNLYKTFNGCIVKVYSSDTEIRGLNAEYGIAEEMAKWCDNNPKKIKESFTLFNLGVRNRRATPNPQIFIATTPKPYQFFIDFDREFNNGNPDYSMVVAETKENIYLSPEAKDTYYKELGASRLGRQELYGDLLVDNPDALWNSEILDKCHMSIQAFDKLITDKVLNIVRGVVAIDPAVSTNPDSDETGIIVAVLCSDNKVYILEDRSGQHSPNDWASIAVGLYKRYNASHIIIESNQGGNLLEQAIKTVDRYVRVQLIHASVGKQTRFEPVVVAYERGDIFHVGDLSRLEAQMLSFNPYAKSGYSPDRVDACAYCVYYLLLGQTAPKVRSTANFGSW